MRFEITMSAKRFLDVSCAPVFGVQLDWLEVLDVVLEEECVPVRYSDINGAIQQTYLS